MNTENIILNNQINKLERFSFGKHKGKMINAVRITDPEYLIWLANTESKYNVSDNWRNWIEDFAEKNKNKIYAGSYGYAKQYI